MNCLAPLVLKSGVVVPCGKCSLCRSDNRNEWSIRLAIHLASCDTMPLFITLTYDDGHLPEVNQGSGEIRHYCDWYDEFHARLAWNEPTLYRPDISAFLKKYKRKYNLRNEDFQYFGCGEYGGKFGRPHYHLLMFGDKDLYTAFFRDTDEAQKRIMSCWPYGFVHVGVAGYDGIHYVTKYVLKDGIDSLPSSSVRPFTIASNGLGMNFLRSVNGKRLKARLDWLQRNKDKVFAGMPPFSYDSKDDLRNVLSYLERYVPKFDLILDDGRKVFLPRAIRKRLVGSFEHFKDSPLWFYTHIRQLLQSLEYYQAYGQYDVDHDSNHSYQNLLVRVEKIKKRLFENKFNNQHLLK